MDVRRVQLVGPSIQHIPKLLICPTPPQYNNHCAAVTVLAKEATGQVYYLIHLCVLSLVPFFQHEFFPDQLHHHPGVTSDSQNKVVRETHLVWGGVDLLGPPF